MPWELSYLTSKDFLFVTLFSCLSACMYIIFMSIRVYMYIPCGDTLHQTIQRPDWLRLLKTYNIITWQ